MEDVSREEEAQMDSTKLSGGTAELRVESGRWVGLKREDRFWTQCCPGELEDVDHCVEKQAGPWRGCGQSDLGNPRLCNMHCCSYIMYSILNITQSQLQHIL